MVRGRALGLALFLSGCASHAIELEVPSDGRRLSRSEQRELQAIADRTVREVRGALPGLPKQLTLVVRWGTSVIPETGETVTAVGPATIYWTVDPARDVPSIIHSQLRPTLIHELHHLVRGSVSGQRRALMDEVITEGMATAFERDLAKVDPPWGRLPPEEWLGELRALPPNAPHDHWLLRNPDGRRWIGMRVGTYVVDRATKLSGRSPADLVNASTDEVLGLAQLK